MMCNPTTQAATSTALGSKSDRIRRARFVVKARPMELRKGLDEAGFNQLADDLETEGFKEKVGREEGA